MRDDKKPAVTRNFMKNLSRGAVKSIPVGGALLEQVIYGTLDGEAAKKEAEKLHTALSGIEQKLEGQDVSFGDVLNALEKEAAFREEIISQIGEIRALLKDPDTAAISDRLVNAVERLLIHNLPYRSMGGLFKGRDELMERLEGQLGRGKTAAITQVQAIHGLGGVGKTRLAVEYAWRQLQAGDINAAFFVAADSAGSLNANLAALASPELLDLPEYNEPKQSVIVEAVLGELGRRTDWLVIFDNADIENLREPLGEILPRLVQGQVIITSRMSNWPDEIGGFPIDKLEEADAAAYLLDKTKGKRTASAEDEQLAKQLAGELDGLPIALEQAAGYINQRCIGFGTYLKDFAQSRKKVLSWRKKGLVSYPVPVVAAWERTERQLGPGERSILRLASFLAPEPVPAGLFESQAGRIAEAVKLLAKEEGGGQQSAAPDEDIRGLLGSLAGWSMISLTEDRFTIHRLVQDSIRLSMPKKRQRAWVELALRLVADYIPKEPPPDDVGSWPVWKTVDSHAAAVVRYADELSIGEPIGRLMTGLGLYLEERARLDEAEPMFRRALEIGEKALGNNHPNVAIALNNLASLLEEMGRFDEAEPMYRRALQIDEKALGEDHPSVARDLNNLAELLRETGRLKEAEPIYRRALEIAEKSFGAEHPKVAICLNNLALLLKETGHKKEAEPMYRRALEIGEETLGPDHPKVAIRLNNLALLLEETGRKKEAEPMYRRALAILEKSFGPEHPTTQTVRENLELLRDA